MTFYRIILRLARNPGHEHAEADDHRGYTLTAPLFARAEIDVGGKTVRIEAPGAPTATHIASARWNGQPLLEPRIAHSALAQGGFLELTLTSGDSTWGANACP